MWPGREALALRDAVVHDRATVARGLVLVGLASLVLYPQLGPDEKRLGRVGDARPPSGLKGMLVASFFAAYIHVSTQLNGARHVINDFYKRFIKPQAGERDLVRLSRIVTIVVMVLSLLDHDPGLRSRGRGPYHRGGSGLGLVLILRWFWWRINAWSGSRPGHPARRLRLPPRRPGVQFPERSTIVAVTTVVWIAVTLLPARGRHPEALLPARAPGGPGWARVAPSSRVRSRFGLRGALVDGCGRGPHLFDAVRGGQLPLRPRRGLLRRGRGLVGSSTATSGAVALPH
jgi:hypothetical protein